MTTTPSPAANRASGQTLAKPASAGPKESPAPEIRLPISVRASVTVKTAASSIAVAHKPAATSCLRETGAESSTSSRPLSAAPESPLAIDRTAR